MNGSIKSSRWIGPTIVALAGSIMLFWSWGTWPDCVRDFGRELYVPWRLSEGDLLYRDIVSYFNGPFSPYLHALMFKLFGVSLRTLVLFNLLVITALVSMMYVLIRRAFGELAAATCGVTFFVLFAFAQLVSASNFNFLCPYSYELPHGITLSVAAILCLDNWKRARRLTALLASGALLGLVFLTKAEVFLGAAAALFGGLLAIMLIEKRSWRNAAPFLIAMIVPAVLALLILRWAGLPFATALRGVAGAWRWMGDRSLLSMPYFKNLAGTDDVLHSIRTIIVWTASYAALLGLAVALAFAIRRSPRAGRSVAAVVVLLLAVAGLWFWQQVNWNNIVRPAPVILLAAAIVFLPRRERSILPFMLIIWSLAMLAKMPLNVHIYHYGFALAMPATLIIIASFIGALPRAVERVGASGNVVRAVALASLITVIHPHLRLMQRFWSAKTFPIGDGGDSFRADSRAQIVNSAVSAIKTTDRDARLVVVPEGLIVNYLTRRTNTTGQLNFTPPALVMYGEDEMLRAFQNAPELVLWVTIDESEYGPRLFGVDYGQRLGLWIQQSYVRQQSWQDSRSGFAMTLLSKRRN